MKKHTRFRVGDTVTWDGAPNQFASTSPGKIISIKKGIAAISGDKFEGQVRKVPVSKLKKVSVYVDPAVGESKASVKVFEVPSKLRQEFENNAKLIACYGNN